VERVGFEPFSLDGCHPIELLIVDRKSNLRKLAKVVGSIPSVDPSFRKRHKDIIHCELPRFILRAYEPKISTDNIR
jgi:hypothetical protein